MNKIPPHCPWHQMEQIWGPPNINWCEETICGFFNEPANTWTNLAYFIVALLIFAHRKKSTNKTYTVYFASTVFFVGVCSFIYHATNNLMTQFLDFVGMFVFCSMLISFNFRRAGWISDQNKIYSFIVLNIILHGSWIWMHFEKMKYQILVFYCILAIVGSELYIRQKIKPNIQYKNLLITLGFFVVAGIFSYLDVSGIWCQPENKLLHGHALWHMLNGTGLYFAYRFYHQFSFTQNS